MTYIYDHLGYEGNRVDVSLITMITKVSNIATVTVTAWFIKVIDRPKTSRGNVPEELCCDCGNFVTGSIAVPSTLRSSEQLFCPSIPKKFVFTHFTHTNCLPCPSHLLLYDHPIHVCLTERPQCDGVIESRPDFA
jgi:hypothetical protein